MSEKVEIVAELKDLVSGKFSEINAQLKQLEAGINRVNSQGTDGLSGGISKGVFSANALMGALKGAGSMAIQFGRDSIESFAKFEQFQTALTTMFHGNQEEAKMLSQQLQKFATETPFELTEIQAATKQMLAFGSSSGSVVSEMRMLGNVSSGIGAPLQDIAYLYGTIRTSGRAMTMDINQFANRGIPIWSELEKITGKTGTALRKYVEQGKVGFPEIQKVFANMTKDGGQFFNLMDAQSKTLGGQLSNLGDAWEQLKVNVGSSQSGILKQTTSWVSDMLNAVNKSMNQENSIEEAVGHSINSSKLMSYIKGVGWAAATPFTGAYGFGKSTQAFAGAANSGNRDELVGLQDKIDKTLLTAVDKHTANVARLDIAREMEMAFGKFKAGSINQATFSDEMKMLNFSLKRLSDRGAIKGDNSQKSGTGSGALDPDKMDVLAKANRPTQMYITIKELVHELNIEAQTVKEGAGEMLSIVSKTLTMAVNDLSVLNNQR